MPLSQASAASSDGTISSLCLSTHLPPGMAQAGDGWRVVDDYYGQAVGKLQAESMMSTAASLFPQ
jgi:hypothetical protein